MSYMTRTRSGVAQALRADRAAAPVAPAGVIASAPLAARASRGPSLLSWVARQPSRPTSPIAAAAPTRRPTAESRQLGRPRASGGVVVEVAVGVIVGVEVDRKSVV
jgi:hypothetical protein